MKDRTSLTKSLHTVSAVVNVALYQRSIGASGGPKMLARLALRILGMPDTWGDEDETFGKCVAGIAKKIGGAK
jgi:hypothetical protein